MQTKKDNLIVKLTFEFSIKIINYCELLNSLRKYQLSNQLFKSGTSIGSNVREAQNAESLSDFIHKIKIAAKEGDETEYWLLLCKNCNSYPDPLTLTESIESINKIISKIISTSKSKTKN
jgi:four helix bundle protein